MHRYGVRIRAALLIGVAAAAAVAGCNQLLGNDPWTLAPTDAGQDALTAQDSGQDSRPPADAAPRADASDATPDAEDCPNGGTRCGGVCTDLAKDARNCGACGHDCTGLPHVIGGGATCAASKCVVPASACDHGWAHCSALPDDGCETNVTQAVHCGDCVTQCLSGAPLCQSNATGGYSCVSGCSGATPTLCGTSCVNTTNDPNHCGSCPNACPQPSGGGVATCASNQCGIACNASSHQCGTSAVCADNADATKCGPSCTFCPVPASNGAAVCASNACAVACSPGYHQCGATPVCAADNDATRCGASCTSCSAPTNGSPTCSGGACGFACNLGFQRCGSACLDLTNDPKNCGACGHDCLGSTCSGSTCQAVTIVTDTDPALRAIAVGGGYVYWTTLVGNTTFRVSRVAIAGGPQQILATGNGCPNLNVLAYSAQGLYFANYDCGGAGVVTPSMLQVPLTGGSVVVVGTATAFNAGVAVDATYAYWNGPTNDAIGRVPLSGGAASAAATGLDNPYGLGGTPGSGVFVFYGQSTAGTGSLAPILGGSINPRIATSTGATLASTSDPTGVYWVDGANPGRVRKTALTGGAIIDIATNENVPRAIVVDGSYVYWVSNAGTLRRASVNGGPAITLYQGPAGGNMISIAMDATTLYWTESDSGRIRKVAK